MKTLPGLLLAAGALAGAHAARSMALESAVEDPAAPSSPFAPSPDAAPFVSLGYHEVVADLLYVRLIGYFNGSDSTASGVADLGEAVAALDPTFQRVYEHAANAITLAKYGVDTPNLLRATQLLEQGMHQFPADWRLPYLAGQIYSQDLKTDDPAQKHAWDERGALLLESATRMPGAPAGAAAWAAIMRSKLGQHERAVASLKEMLLVTNDESAKQRLFRTLADLEARDASSVEAEIREERTKFERRWREERYSVTPTFFVLVGPRIVPGFDLGDLATGGRDLIVETQPEPLEPVE